jgi:SAM-dependent methyltransferase
MGSDRNSRIRRLTRDWLADVASRLPEDAVVLDLGCGPGRDHALFRGRKMVGLDRYAADNIQIVADAEKPLPIADASYDAVFSNHVMEHLCRPEDTLRECHRILRAGGTLMVSVPFMTKIHLAPDDFCRFTEHWYARVLSDIGFRDIAATPIGNLFDLYDVTRWARDEQLRNKSGGLRHVALRRLIQMQNLAQRGIDRLSGGLKDDTSWPLGYGVTARKPS